MPDFSTPASHAIDRPITPSSHPSPSLPAPLSLSTKYDIPTTLRAILDGSYKTVALQFPDEMLGESVLVYRGLMAGLKRAEERGEGGEGVQCFVIGDSTYGSCCPDILSAMHLPADFLVHYGHACLTPTTALPVLYIFPKLLFPTEQIRAAAEELYQACAGSLKSRDLNPDRDTEEEEGKKAVVVVWDVGYDWVGDQIREAFESSSSRPANVPLVFSHIKRHHSEKRSRLSATTARPLSAPPISNASLRGGSGAACCGSGSSTGHGCCESGNTQGTSTCSCGGPGEVGGRDEEHSGPQQEEIVDLGGIQIQIPLSELTAEAPIGKASPSVPAPTLEADDPDPDTEIDTGSLRVMDLPDAVEMKDCVIFYIGEESRGMINFMMENARSEIWQYSPATSTHTPLHLRTPLLLRPRLFALSRFLSLTTIGILVHNVGLHSSRPLIKKIKEELKRKGKKSYTVSVGRLNPAKVGNLEVVEGWVLVGCREGGLVDPKEYSKPIITPHELFLALQGESGIARWADADRFGWTLNMGKVMNEADVLRKEEESDSDADDGDASDLDGKDEDRPVFSLVSGQYHSKTRAAGSDSDSDSDPDHPSQSTALALRSTATALSTHVRTLDSAASTHLANRSYKGLDPLEGYTEEGVLEPSVLQEGRRGVARGYGMVGDRVGASDGATKTQGTS